MRPVNLIPPEDRRGEHAPLRAGAVSYAIVGFLALALVGVVLMVLAGNEISENEAELAALEAAEGAGRRRRRGSRRVRAVRDARAEPQRDGQQPGPEPVRLGARPERARPGDSPTGDPGQPHRDGRGRRHRRRRRRRCRGDQRRVRRSLAADRRLCEGPGGHGAIPRLAAGHRRRDPGRHAELRARRRGRGGAGAASAAASDAAAAAGARAAPTARPSPRSPGSRSPSRSTPSRWPSPDAGTGGRGARHRDDDQRRGSCRAEHAQAATDSADEQVAEAESGAEAVGVSAE